MDHLHLISELLLKYQSGDLNGDELQQLNAWIKQDPANRLLFEKLSNPDTRDRYLLSLLRDKKEIFDKILPQIQEPKHRTTFQKLRASFWKFSAAAALVVALVSAILLYVVKSKEATQIRNEKDPSAKFAEIRPGTDVALLTLSDGSVIKLSDTLNGNVSMQGNTAIQLSAPGTIQYLATLQPGNVTEYNSIQTPRGGQYKIILPDGTSVWLNAQSNLKFPVAFNEKNRVVVLEGEAYFDVSKNDNQPFVVQVTHPDRVPLEITVLGTEFNISAYEKNSIKTTLVSGAIKLSQGSKAIVVKPKQQIEANLEGFNTIESGVDLEEILDWKNGFIIAKNSSIEEFMSKVSRWYNIDVEIKQPTIEKYYFKISKKSTITEITNVLNAAGIKATIHGRKITVE